MGQRAELRALISSAEVSVVVGTRAPIVLWLAEGRTEEGIAGWPGCRVRRWIYGWPDTASAARRPVLDSDAVNDHDPPWATSGPARWQAGSHA
jgi:hypothetical protein